MPTFLILNRFMVRVRGLGNSKTSLYLSPLCSEGDMNKAWASSPRLYRHFEAADSSFRSSSGSAKRVSRIKM